MPSFRDQHLNCDRSTKTTILHAGSASRGKCGLVIATRPELSSVFSKLKDFYPSRVCKTERKHGPFSYNVLMSHVDLDIEYVAGYVGLINNEYKYLRDLGFKAYIETRLIQSVASFTGLRYYDVLSGLDKSDGSCILSKIVNLLNNIAISLDKNESMSLSSCLQLQRIYSGTAEYVNQFVGVDPSKISISDALTVAMLILDKSFKHLKYRYTESFWGYRKPGTDVYIKDSNDSKVITLDEYISRNCGCILFVIIDNSYELKFRLASNPYGSVMYSPMLKSFKYHYLNVTKAVGHGALHDKLVPLEDCSDYIQDIKSEIFYSKACGWSMHRFSTSEIFEMYPGLRFYYNVIPEVDRYDLSSESFLTFEDFNNEYNIAKFFAIMKYE